MLPRIKGLISNHKKEVKIGLVVLVGLILLIILYKSLFYSTSEKAVYGVRLRDLKEHELTTEQRVKVHDKVEKMDGISAVKITVKGRLIKFFITFDEGISADDMKAKCNDTLALFSDDIKNYYDITYYVIQKSEDKTTYPIIGYKKKGTKEISFDVF